MSSVDNTGGVRAGDTAKPGAPAVQDDGRNWDYADNSAVIDAFWLGSSSEARLREALLADLLTCLDANGPILEIGCGSGMIYQEMLRGGIVTPATYTGGDVSQSMLRIAKERFPGAQFLKADVMRLPFAARSQPNVLCIQVLQHLAEYQAAVLELMRIAGRRLYIVTMFHQGHDDVFSFVRDLPDEKGPGFHVNHYSLPKFLRFVRENAGRPISDVRVKCLVDSAHSVCIHFGQDQDGGVAPPPQEHSGSVALSSEVVARCHVHIADLAIQRQQSRDEANALRKRVAETDAQAAALRTELATTVGLLEQRGRDLAEARDEICALRAQVAEAEGRAATLRTQLATTVGLFEQHRHVLAEARDELIALREQVAQAEALAAALRARLDQAQDEADALRKQAAEAQAQTAAARAELAATAGLLEQRGRDLAQAQDTARQTQDRLAAESAERQRGLSRELAHAHYVAVQATRALADAQWNLPRRPRLSTRRDDLWDSVSAAYQQFKDDAILFGIRGPGWRLAAVYDLAGPGRPFRSYPLRLGAVRLNGIALALVCPVLGAEGALGIEVVSPDRQIVLNTARPLREFQPDAPFPITFEPISIDARNGWELRVFASGNTVPVGLFEFQKARWLGIRRPWRRPFIALSTV